MTTIKKVDNCIIINLDDRQDLWQSLTQFRELWTKLDKQYIRIPGINYKNNVNVINDFIIKNRISLNGSGFRKNKKSFLGELGCYMAHFNAWNYVVENKLETCLILEDNIELLRTDFMNLHIEENLDILFINEEMKYMNNQFIGYGTQGYVVTNTGAMNLIEKCYTLNCPIDLHMRHMCNIKELTANITIEPFVKRSSDKLSSIGYDFNIKNFNINEFEIDNLNVDDPNLKQDQNNILSRLLTNLIKQNVNLDNYI